MGSFEKGNLLFESVELTPEQAVVFDCPQEGDYVVSVDVNCSGTHLSQNTVILHANGEYLASFTVAGANGKNTKTERAVTMQAGRNTITLKRNSTMVSLEKIRIYEAL